SFGGTYLEVEPPTRTVETWLFEGRPGGDAVESQDLHEAHGVTTLTGKLAFTDPAGRPTTFAGMEESFDRIDDVVRSLVERSGAAAASLGLSLAVSGSRSGRRRLRVSAWRQERMPVERGEGRWGERRDRRCGRHRRGEHSRSLIAYRG